MRDAETESMATSVGPHWRLITQLSWFDPPVQAKQHPAVLDESLNATCHASFTSQVLHTPRSQ